jgi:microcystin-dependent protein
MAYTPREIKDRVAVGDDIFIVEDLGDNRIRLIPAPTHVSEPGTPVNKALLQPIEDFLATLGTGGLVPPGAIIMWSGAINNIPVGWALCDGSNGTPDLRDRFIVGAGGSYNVGNTGGSNTVRLTTSQIPSHSHTASIGRAGDHRHGMGSKWLMSGTGSASNPGTSGPGFFATSEERTTGWAGEHSHSITVSSTGGGQAHENRPPYYALCFIMKL